jgi:UDP-N-acetylglucosamine 2-epimerase (non-hydrolysing)
LRTDTLDNPFPEEMNRRVTSRLAALHFAPTPRSEANLLSEAVDPAGIFLTGNTVIDALLTTARRQERPLAGSLRRILVTAHRRENWGQPMEDICGAVLDLVEAYPDVEAVFPAHLNPLVQDVARRVLGQHPRVQIVAPLDYEPFVQAMQEATLILTDSGGVQEEAPSLGKPVLVMRTTTERPEAVDAGTVRLVGVQREEIVRHARELLDDAAAYERMARAVNPYGDGQAAPRIREAVRHFLGLRDDRPTERFRIGEAFPTHG